LAQTQVWPVLRYFEAMAPSTAASRSASSKTMKGALPPSSSETFLMVGAHCAMSSRPTSVEPVKDSLRTIGLPVSSPPIFGAAAPVTTLKTPGGIPARCPARPAPARSGVCSAGFTTMVQPAASAGAGLARDHRRREIPRRDRGADADRLLEDDQRASACVGESPRRRYALGLLGEPLDEARRVGDLAARLGQRLALLGGHQPRQVVLSGFFMACFQCSKRRRILPHRTAGR
jgi:hypothetical protein